MSKQIKLEYDDNVIDIIEQVNDVIRNYGLQFKHEEEHDGFEIFTLFNTVEK